MSFTLVDGVLTVAVIAGILALMWSVRRVASHLGFAPEVQRKLVHIATGCTALTFPLLFSGPLPVFVLTGAATVVMLVLRGAALSSAGIGSVLHSVERKSYGEIYLAFAIALIFFRSQGYPVLYVLPILVVTLSDTASALVGTSYGRNRFTVDDGSKSLEGVVAFFVVTWLCAMITLLLMTDADRVNVIVLSLLTAVFCALVEADSWRGLDNLFVPVGAHLLLVRHLYTGPAELVLIAVLFALSMATMLSFAPLMKMSGHAARAYTILIFLVLSVAGPYNAILPILVIATHIPARIFRPCASTRPDLDLLAIATGVALLWLLAGETLGLSAINLFNLTFAGVSVVFAGLALAGRWRLALVPIALAIGAILVRVSNINPPDTLFLTPDWPLMLAAVALPCAVVLWRPEWFDTRRSVRAFTLALIVPVMIFVGGHI